MKPILYFAAAALLGLPACNLAPLNVKFVEPQIAQFKGHGNSLAVAEGSLDGDVLAIEIMKNGKFVLASRETSSPKSAASPAPAINSAVPPTAAATAAMPTDSAPAATPAPQVTAMSAPSAGVDYVIRVNTITNLYNTGNNTYPATYSLSVTAETGEIIYIKALTGGDLKTELASTVAELAGLLI